MKREKCVVTLTILVLLMSTNPIISPPAGGDIWVDRSSYCIGDPIRITFLMPANGRSIIWDHMTNGRTEKIFDQSQECGESHYMTITGRTEGPPGSETLELEVYSGTCGGGFGLAWWKDSVSFSVEDCDPCKNVTCENRCFDCDYWAMDCEDRECVQDYIIERNSKECGSECPCRNVTCSNQCYGCEYWAMRCDNGDCVKDDIIEEDSEQCGCGNRDEENARKKLYENYAKALDPWYWNNEGNSMLLMFGRDFYDSFTTPFGILKSVAKKAALGKYDNAELMTKEVVSLSGYLSCMDMSYTLSQTYLEAKLPYGFQEHMNRVSELIGQGETDEAEKEIRTLCSSLLKAYQNVDKVGVGGPGGSHENSMETAKKIIRAAIGFLEAECLEHCNNTCQCNVPKEEQTPRPTPEPGPCIGTDFVCLVMLFGIILKYRSMAR